jgi:hypothetical protein
MIDTDADLSRQARKAAPAYGNDWGVLLIKMADALDRHSPWKEGDLRCDDCDNGIQSDWKFCAWCGSSAREDI